MNGRWIVAVLLLGATGAASGAAWYRHAARPGWARQLGDETRRGLALRKLLGLNGLFGAGREGIPDASPASPGRQYVHAHGVDGRLWHVVRASTASASGGRERGAFVFTGDGDVAHYIAGGAPFVVARGDGQPLAMVLAPQATGFPGACVWLVGADLQSRLAARGAFGVQDESGDLITLDQPPQPPPAGDPLPWFRFDASRQCFSGPRAAADKPLEMLPAASPGHCAE